MNKKSFFINSDTGKIVFPVYTHDPAFLVEIKDLTDYNSLREKNWEKLEQNESRNVDDLIRHLESNISNEAMFEIEPFSTLFLRSKDITSPYDFLLENEQEIEKLVEIIEKKYDEFFLLETEFEDVLRDNGLIKKLQLPAVKSERETLLESYTVKKLKTLSKNAGLKVSLHKEDLVKQLSDMKNSQDVLPYYYDLKKIKEVLHYFFELYLNDIIANSKRYHFLYLGAVWKAVIASNENTNMSYIIDKAKNIKDNAEEKISNYLNYQHLQYIQSLPIQASTFRETYQQTAFSWLKLTALWFFSSIIALGGAISIDIGYWGSIILGVGLVTIASSNIVSNNSVYRVFGFTFVVIGMLGFLSN